MIYVDEFDCNLSIDTLFLTARLNDNQRDLIYDRFSFNKNNPVKWHWHYSQLDTKHLGFSLHALPTKSFTYSHYDHMIQLQNGITTANYIPYSLSEIIHNIDWNIKRIDFAFDFRTPKEQAMPFKHHLNCKFDMSTDKWDTEYLGSLKGKSASKLAFYDRNDKEQERGTNIYHEYSNRYEVRLYPKSNDETMKLHSMQDDYILNHLSKYIILPNIDTLPTTQWNKNRLYKVKADPSYAYFKGLNPKYKNELKAITKANRIPLERLYLENKHKLFNFLEVSYMPLQQAI